MWKNDNWFVIMKINEFFVLKDFNILLFKWGKLDVNKIEISCDW